MAVSICAKQTVAEILESYPQTSATFQALKTNCAGCHLAPFCTLEDVARTYELAPRDLVDTLRGTAQSLLRSNA
jgi:hybrid cluster-associated redox disulfide protein